MLPANNPRSASRVKNPKNVGVAVKMVSLLKLLMIGVEMAPLPNRVAAIDKMVRPRSRVVVIATRVNYPKRVVATAESPPNKIADTAIARRSFQPRIRGLALSRNN